MPHGKVVDWKADGTRPVPGVDFPELTLAERDCTQIAVKMGALGPLADSLGATTKGITYELSQPVEQLRHENGLLRGAVTDGRPRLDTDTSMCEAIPALSGTTNGHLAV